MRFEDNSSSPDLKHEAGPREQLSSHPISSTMPNLSSHDPCVTSMPSCATILLNKTFDISQIAPLSSNQQDAAAIAAEVSTAVAAQALKEFCHMCEPKIIKCKGGYSTDAELIFCSWHMVIGTVYRNFIVQY